MNSRSFLLLAALALVWTTPFVQAGHYKLFVLTGQSNSLGTTNGGEVDPTSGADPADTHIKFYWHNVADAETTIGTSGGVFKPLQDQQGGVYAGSATHWGPEMNFGRMLYRAGVRNFGIIKASRGGGGNTLWSKADGGHMYSHVVKTVNSATATLTANGDTFEIVGLLYLQGESDSTAEASEAGTRFKTLVDNLRADLPNAANLHGVIGGIAAAGTARDTVRANHSAIGASTPYIDYFSNLDLQSQTAADGLHFHKAAKLRVGERFAQAFFAAGTVMRHYGRLTFIGDSITQGGNGDHPSYRYYVFKNLASQGVPVDAATGYKFTGSVTGPYANSVLTVPSVNGQAFENAHDGHFGWRTRWVNARVPLPVGRYNVNNLGHGTILNWTGTGPSPLSYQTADAPTTKPYTGITYTPDTVSIMIGINDLGDNNNSANQVIADIGTLVDQLRVSNPKVRIHINRLLYTNQTQAMRNAVDAVNGQLQTLADTKNSASAMSPVWIIDASTGFDPVTQTYDNVHPNNAGEAFVGDRIAAALGIIESPFVIPPAQSPEPPHLESGSTAFAKKFEGHEIYDGTTSVNGWSNTGTQVKTVVPDSSSALTDLRATASGTGGLFEGTNTGWNNANNGDWTFETRLKFGANANGFILWLCTDTHRILVEIYGDRTQDFGSNTFNAAHNNLDGQFHTFRVAHESVAGKYHVWRDGVRLTSVAGVAYDQTAADSRKIMGDYTSGTFGNDYDVTLDYVRYDQTAAWLPTGADVDGDGMPDSWEYAHFRNVTGAAASADGDGDGKTNREEYAANPDPQDSSSAFAIGAIAAATGDVMKITLNATSPQRHYTLYKSANLSVSGAWTPVTGPVTGNDGALIFHDRISAARAFYRVEVSIP